MATANSHESYLRDKVSRMTHDDPQSAEVALELMLLTDCSTPVGAAARVSVVNILYEQTGDRQRARDKFLAELKVKLKAIQAPTSQ